MAGHRWKKNRKTRYSIPYMEGVIELDIYFGKLDGLLTTEMKFKTEAQRAIASRLLNGLAWKLWKTKDLKNKNLAVQGILSRRRET